MEPKTLSELAAACGGIVERGDARLLISDVFTDTREDCADRLYVPLTGEKFDGHKFIGDAAKKGAAGCLTAKGAPRRLPNGFAVVRVRDTLAAYQAVASRNRDTCGGPVIAITGSCGKTTTKNMIRNVLARRQNIVATEKNENNEVGVPRTLLRIGARTGAAVLEFGMRAPGEIRTLTDITRPDMAVITNIEKTHIGRLGSEEAIARAKGEIIENAAAGMPAFLNADNPWTLWLARRTRANIVTFGIKQGHVRARDIACDLRGVSFTVHAPGACFKVSVPMFGRANVYNALAAIAVALVLNMDPDDIRAGLFQDIPEQGRMRRIHTNNGTVVLDDSYNSNPTSLAFALDTLGEIAWPGRKVAVLADMLELGEFSKDEHHRIGLEHVDGRCDLLIGVGEQAAEICEGALETGMDSDMVMHFDNFGLLKRRSNSIFIPGDLVLVKGSRGMQMERVVELLSGGRA